MTVINTNSGAIYARKAGLSSQSAQRSAMERLSSGLRVNSAGDDAAGLAVASKMEAQIRSIDMAVRNSMDGISLIDTATSGISTNLNILQRMRELSIQSSNGIYDGLDRRTLQLEIDESLKEMRKTSNFTQFNGIKLLDGSLDTTLRVGNENAEIVTVQIDGVGVDQTMKYDKDASGAAYQIAEVSTILASEVEFREVDEIGRDNSYTLASQRSAFGGSKRDLLSTSEASIVSGSAFSSVSSFTSKSGRFENNSFADNTVEATTATPFGTKVEIPGWDIYLERIDLGPAKAGLYRESVGGHPTPDDPTPTAGSNVSGDGDATDASDPPKYYYDTGSDGLELTVADQNRKDRGFSFDGVPFTNYSALHGPWVISDNAVSLAAGDSVQFNWTARGVLDYYDVFGYLLDQNTGKTVLLLDQTGNTGSGVVRKTIGAGDEGDYNFVFISGTQDDTGGLVAGAEFFIDNIVVDQANPPPITATATVGVEAVEAAAVTINPLKFDSLEEIRKGDPEGKYYITGGADADKFHIDLFTGLTTSKSTLLRAHQEIYNFDIQYIGPSGDNHTESVTLTITPGNKATAEYQSLEAAKINIANTAKGLDEYKSAYGSGGTYRLEDDDAKSGDFDYFSIDTNGDIASVQTFDIGINGLLGTFRVGETITGAETSATGIYISDDGTNMILKTISGTFSSGETLTGGTSGATTTTSSTTIARDHLKFINQIEYNFKKVYEISNDRFFTERIKLTLIDPIIFSRSELSASEGKIVKIGSHLNKHLGIWAKADDYKGRFYLEASSLSEEDDSKYFTIDKNGHIKSTGYLDFESGKTEFEFKVIYQHSSQKVSFTDYVQLKISNDIRDENNLAIDDINIATIEGAESASTRLNSSINKVSSVLAELGALKNRLLHNIDYNVAAKQNLEISKGRIIDADFALESSKLAKQQVLSQASNAMLAQANQVKATVLDLLS